MVNVVFNDIHGELLIDTVNDYHGFSIYKPDGKYFNRIDTSFPTGIPNNTAFMIYNGNVSYGEEGRLAYYRTSNTPVNANHSLDLSSDIQKIFIVIQSKGTSRFDWTYTIAFVDE